MKTPQNVRPSDVRSLSLTVRANIAIPNENLNALNGYQSWVIQSHKLDLMLYSHVGRYWFFFLNSLFCSPLLSFSHQLQKISSSLHSWALFSCGGFNSSSSLQCSQQFARFCILGVLLFWVLRIDSKFSALVVLLLCELYTLTPSTALRVLLLWALWTNSK